MIDGEFRLIGAYPFLMDRIVSRGRPVPSRYGDTWELRGETFALPAGTVVRRKKFNRKLAWMELLEIVAGVFDPDKLAEVAPKAKHSLFTPQMAYGPRLKVGLPAAVDYLRGDREGRQAILFVGTPGDGMSSNLPCTIALHALVRDDRLELSGMMRSWDAVKGLSIDMVCFGGIALLLAHALGIPAGDVTMFASSLHVYTEDIDVKGCTPMYGVDRFGIDPALVPTDWPGIVNWATWAMDTSRWIDNVPPGILYTKGEPIDTPWIRGIRSPLDGYEVKVPAPVEAVR